MRPKHDVSVFQNGIRAFDQPNNVMTDLFVHHDIGIVDVDGDLRRQCQWSNEIASTRRRENFGEFDRAAFEERFEESLIACELRRHDAIHPLHSADISRSGRLCPATCRSGSRATGTSGGSSSAQGLLGLCNGGIRLGERRLSLSQCLFCGAWRRRCCSEPNRRLCTQCDGSGRTAARSRTSGRVASGNCIEYRSRQCYGHRRP